MSSLKSFKLAKEDVSLEIKDAEVIADAGSGLDNGVSDHTKHTIGNTAGYISRRIAHAVACPAVIYLYYFHAFNSDWLPLNMTPEHLVSLFCFTFFILECARAYFGVVYTGMREYERFKMSAMAWATISCGLVMLAAPQKNAFGKDGHPQTPSERAIIGFPIVCCLALIDPLIGELKRIKISLWTRSIIAIAATALIWIALLLITGEGVWVLIPFIAPITVAAEYPFLEYIDDDATMTLIPLAVTIFVQPFLF